MKNIVVIGATGLVGGAVATALAHAGNAVLAVGRNTEALQALLKATPSMKILTGDVGSDGAAAQTAENALAMFGHIDVVIASINPPRSAMRISRAAAAEVSNFFDQTLFSHLAAANAFIPRLSAGGKYIGVGGASSDFVWPDYGHICMNQAAQRMMFRVLAAEWSGKPVTIHEYVIAAMVQEDSAAKGSAVAASAVGEDLAARLGKSAFEGQPTLRFPAQGDH
jgi:NAD(P)-dependent dehydrogenase (short-subunit alcohol dehydrogenase family)